MNRNLMLKAISIIVLAAIICFAAVQSHEAYIINAAPLSADSKAGLMRYKESLEGTILQLRSELAGKRNELAGLDQKLMELELQYDRLVEENRKITERISKLKRAEQK